MTGGIGLALLGLLWIGINLRRRPDPRRAQEAKLAQVRVAAERHHVWVVSIHQAHRASPARNLHPDRGHLAIARTVIRPSHLGNRPPGMQRERRVRQFGDPPARVAGTPVHRGLAQARQPTPARLRFTVLQRDGFRCQYCGRTAADPGVVLHVDHVVPVAVGGATSASNLVTACADCNLGKSSRPVVASS